MSVEPKPTPFKIDKCYRTDDEMGQFASRMEVVTDAFQKWMESCMEDTESAEFYQGLMAGYAACHALAQQIPISDFPTYIHNITAFLAAKVRRMNQDQGGT